MTQAQLSRAARSWVRSAVLLGCLPLGLLTAGALSAEPGVGITTTAKESTAVLDTGPHALGRSLKNLDPAHWMPMREGKQVFVYRFRADGKPGLDGLGSLLNADSCSSCHFRDGRGSRRGAASASPPPLIFRLAHETTGAPDSRLGRQLQDRALDGQSAEGRIEQDFIEQTFTYPDRETAGLWKPQYKQHTDMMSHDPQTRFLPRVPPTLVGMGLLEAVPTREIAQLHDPDDRDGDGISGRLSSLTTANGSRTGKFGWKASHPDLRHQTLAALRHDMGVEQHEIDEAYVDALVLYLRLLAPPARRHRQNAEVLKGEKLFMDVGCGACHRPTLNTGSQDEIDGPRELADQRLRPYTDLLLHDMGDELADPAAEPGNEPREWRTAPLWGLGLLPVVNGERRLLHDGRARTFEEAILWHGGEAADSRNRFTHLDARDRRRLVDFLESL